MIHLKVTNKIKFAFQVLEDNNISTIDFRSTIKNFSNWFKMLLWFSEFKKDKIISR